MSKITVRPTAIEYELNCGKLQLLELVFWSNLKNFVIAVTSIFVCFIFCAIFEIFILDQLLIVDNWCRQLLKSLDLIVGLLKLSNIL